jgi:uncharacterized protein
MTDPLAGLIGFARSLRHAGLAVDAHRVEAYLQALDALDLTSPVQAYWAGRLTLCSQPDDLVRYDAAFSAWFSPGSQDDLGPPLRQPGRPRPSRIAALTMPVAPATPSTIEDEDQQPLRAAASDTELLRHRDLSDLTPAEREHLRSVIAMLRPQPPARTSLRYRPTRRPRDVDPRATLRATLRAHGELARPRHRRRGTRPRKIVLLLDVSGSMAPYSDALLRFAHAVVRRAPLAVEAFTLGTRLTRVTLPLRHRDPERALAEATRAVPDWSGGTRLGETIRAFLDRWGQRGAARGAVVVICSDGWERGEADLLAAQMSRLRRLAHKVIWSNPHAGHAGYAPVQSGIAAALPHVDRLLAGHSLASLEELLAEVRRA